MKEIYDFLRELRENNDREWFNAHKKRYVELKAWFDEWVGKLIEKTAGFDEEIEGLNVKDCVYRIYRDVRFLRINLLIRLILQLTLLLPEEEIVSGRAIMYIWNPMAVCWEVGYIVRNPPC